MGLIECFTFEVKYTVTTEAQMELYKVGAWTWDNYHTLKTKRLKWSCIKLVHELESITTIRKQRGSSGVLWSWCM